MADFAPPLRILIAADHALARAGLASILASRADLQVVGQSALGDDLEGALDVHWPDVVICDLGYDPLQAVAALAAIAGDGPPVLALAADVPAAAEAVSALLGAGVRGVLLQDVPADALASALVAVGHGLTVFGPGIAPVPVVPQPPEAPVEALTPREREVLGLLAEGLPNKLIARQLQISEHTVKFHVNALLTKLGAASRTEAVVRATRLGLIAL